jgi:hypothetical protein
MNVTAPYTYPSTERSQLCSTPSLEPTKILHHTNDDINNGNTKNNPPEIAKVSDRNLNENSILIKIKCFG